MPYPKNKDMRVKLNEKDIQKIMTWYWDAMGEQVDADGQPLTEQAKEKNAKVVEELLPKVPAIYMDLIQNVVLENWKPYGKLKVDKPEHPAFHLETGSRFREDPEHEHEIGRRNSVTGDYSIDIFMHMRSTGKYAEEVFGRMSRGGYKLCDLERARKYCRENGYDHEMTIVDNDLETIIEDNDVLEAEIDAAVKEELLADERARADAERERMEALEAGIEEGDAVMAEVEAEMNQAPPRSAFSRFLIDVLNGKAEISENMLKKGEVTPVKSGQELMGEASQKKMVDWQGKFENVPITTRKQEQQGLEKTARMLGMELDDPTPGK